mmetsp:Transcript_25239/g.38858  ORF Transcript_25239/g.38858 Transcript_25239/m.38858 type:complete len:280 (-) Transcript_25239:195-1034(-)|eukprot:CAMPEP_0195287836 /NCGR_PEP_ID=MMETSP0707-20130614/4741_1 /TAXON_ID=33640 /ORGANISM="Asterionellopsis glacialis, Strain CCMP134" /LENGTH=279 /DNA_ID=CAMNT_0040347633 /DNA_START=63 /DNA_END=902 /DNA_ORIENTATION=+
MKLVLVTGANKGIGQAICRLLLTDYSDVHVLLGSRDISRGDQACLEILQGLPVETKDRLEVLEIDVSSDSSVKQAASTLQGQTLYGIVNNAGIGFGYGLEQTRNTNYFGPRRVNDAFSSLLQRPGGRIVNVASASGPYFMMSCRDANLKKSLKEPLKYLATTKSSGIEELDALAKASTSNGDDDAYGFSKAFLNAYTVLHAQQEPDLLINSVTPGFIATDITKGMGATKPPSQGAIPPVWLLMSKELESLPTGRFYGSDCQRSPLHEYRDPGSPPYDGP